MAVVPAKRMNVPSIGKSCVLNLAVGRPHVWFASIEIRQPLRLLDARNAAPCVRSDYDLPFLIDFGPPEVLGCSD